MDNIKTVQHKSVKFSVRIVNMYRYLCKNGREYDLYRQVLRSGTSIGANIAEAECAISKKDFLAKMYISLKEATETLYWLDLFYKCGILREEHYKSISSDCLELRRMLVSITKTTSETL